MAENITYAEMNLTTGKGKGQKKNAVHLQDEKLGVSYAAVKRLPKNKKEKSSKSQKVHLQDEKLGVSYAAVKRLPKNKKEKSSKSQKDSGVEETVTYAALKGMSKKESKKGEETEKDQSQEKRTKDTYLALNTHEERSVWTQRIFPGRRCSVILVPLLTAMSLVLLICAITGLVLHARATTSPGNGSAVSSAADPFSRCPDPWILITNKCYLFSENRKNRKESETDCKRQDAKLAMVKAGTILKLVSTTKQEFWIGLTSRGTEHQEKWTGKWDDQSIETVTNGRGSCAKISDGRLILDSCLQELHWICEKP